jgi:hypothetical protein
MAKLGVNKADGMRFVGIYSLRERHGFWTWRDGEKLRHRDRAHIYHETDQH